jgi:phospholipid transport system transporter-binding protein
VNEARLDSTGEGKFRIEGNLDYNTVKQLLDQDSSLFSQNSEHITIDLGGIDRTTSVGLALMLEWLRQARSKNKSIQFINVPEQILAMARISQLETILQLVNPETSQDQ